MSHSSPVELSEKYKKAKELVTVGGIYHHYKNPDQHYEVLAIAFQEADEQICVVYKSLYGDSFIWVRNIDSWLDTVVYQNKTVNRFIRINQR